MSYLPNWSIVAIIVVIFGGAGIWWWLTQLSGPAQSGPPTSVAATPTPPPSCDPGTGPCTPEVAAEQAELKKLRAEAERTYRATFAEREKLSSEGGATNPTPILLENADGDYLAAVMALLKDQEARGEVIRSQSTTNVKPAPNAGEGKPGVDPRLSLDVCEDNSKSSWLDKDGVSHPSTSFAGKIFVGQSDGRIKVIGADLAEVSSCAGW